MPTSAYQKVIQDMFKVSLDSHRYFSKNKTPFTHHRTCVNERTKKRHKNGIIQNMSSTYKIRYCSPYLNVGDCVLKISFVWLLIRCYRENLGERLSLVTYHDYCMILALAYPTVYIFSSIRATCDWVKYCDSIHILPTRVNFMYRSDGAQWPCPWDHCDLKLLVLLQFL